MKGISYKCIDCDHSFAKYVLDNGIEIKCRITGEILIIDKCPMGE